MKFTQLFQQKSHKPPETFSHVPLFGAKTLNCDEEGQIAQVQDRTVYFSDNRSEMSHWPDLGPKRLH